MPPEAEHADLVGLEPDPGLLGGDAAQLPPSVGHPEPLPPESPARRRVVGAGAALTGITLVLGILLIIAGIGEAVSDTATLGIALLVLGVAFVGTHWGWVHVAELTGNAIETRRNVAVLDRRRDWLADVAPYERWEVSTSTGEDGSIAIVTVHYTPVPRSDRTFTFKRNEVEREVHSADEPAATVAERAELTRRQAAANTEQARERYEAAREAYETARLADADEQERLAAARAASQALSERINSNLSDPPLAE